MSFIRAVAERAKSHARAIVQSEVPGGTVKGNEYVAVNPTRNDSSAGSFSISIFGDRAGAWADFATDDRGGDLVSLVAYVKRYGNKQHKAAIYLNDAYGLGVEQNGPVKNAQGKAASRASQGKPDFTFTYCNPDGTTQFQVHRYDPIPEKGYHKKEFRQFHVIGDGVNEPQETVWRKPNPPHHPWRAEIIKNFIDSGVAMDYIIVEGETTAIAAQDAFIAHTDPNTERPALVTTWAGGAVKKTVDQVEWGLFRGQRVILIPDDDDTGRKVMGHLAGKLDSVKAKVSIADICRTPEGQTGRDVDDLWNDTHNPKTWNIRHAIKAYFAQHGDDWKPFRDATVGIDKTEMPAELVREIMDNPDLDRPFRPLGMGLSANDEVVYYFLSIRRPLTKNQSTGRMTGTGRVHAWKPSQFASNNFYSLADKAWWETTFITAERKRAGVPWAQITNMMMQDCQNEGYVQIENIVRGCGAWPGENGGAPMLNFGTSVYNTRTREWQTPAEAHENKRVYLTDADLTIPHNPKADAYDTLTDLDEYRQAIASLDWSLRLSGEMLCGWAMMAPFGGVLRFRPHLYITGTTGAGKSEMLKNAVIPMLGPWKKMVEGATTTAGLRNTIAGDSLPVTFDESDIKAGRDAAAQAQNMMHLARVSSTESQAAMRLAGPGGGMMLFKPRSMLALCAVNPMLQEEADQNRFIQAHLEIKRGWSSEGRQKHWNDTLDKLHKIGLLDGDLAARSFWYWADHLDALTCKGGLFDVVQGMLGAIEGVTSRDAQRLCAPFAAMMVVQTRGEILREGRESDRQELVEERKAEIVAMCKRGVGSDNDTFIDTLFSMTVKIEGQGADTRSLGYMIDCMFRVDNEYRLTLNSCGIVICYRQGQGSKGIFVASTNGRLQRHFAGTRWAAGYTAALKNMGAVDHTTKIDNRTVRGYFLTAEQAGIDTGLGYQAEMPT